MDTHNAKTCDTHEKEGNLYSSKYKMKGKINVKTYAELNSASGFTKIHTERINNESNKKTNKTNNQAHMGTPHGNSIKVIGTGPSHIGGGIKNSFHGVSYQMKLPMHFILSGLKKNCTFQVATEVEDADKFDDLVFLYEENEIGLFQAKHKLDEDSKITEGQLLDMDGDFSIPKYFNSYNQILNNKKLLKDRNMTLILRTNIGFDNSVADNFEHVTASQILAGNHILALGTEKEKNNYYILKTDSQLYNELDKLLSNEKLQSSRKEPPSRMAERLAKKVLSSGKKTSQSNPIDRWFENNHEWILDNVFQVDKDSEKQDKVYVTFKDTFLSEKCELNFRKAFSKTYFSNKQTEAKDKTSLQDHLSGVKFDISESFALTLNKKTAKTGKDEVIKFLNLLVFAVNQPNDTKLGDIIENEISDYMGLSCTNSIASKFILYIQKWATQKEGRYLKNEDIVQQFAVWGQEPLNLIRTNDVKKYGCTFQGSHVVLKNLSNFLMMANNSNVLYLYNREELFSKIKVCQALETFVEKHMDQHFIFCDFNDLIELKDTEKCPIKAFSSTTCNILFLSLQEGKSHDIKVLNQLSEIIIKSNRSPEKPRFVKRLIISVPEKEKSEYANKFGFETTGIKCESLNDFENTFNELDEKSRLLLMERSSIKLHGDEVKDLLPKKELSLCIQNENLFKFITSALEIGSGLADTNQYYNVEVKQYYVNRSLEPIIVAREITKDPQFHFILDEILQTNVKNQDVVVISPNENLFKQFRKTNENVHWLKETNNEYEWVNSQGSLSNLRKYVVTKDTNHCLESDSDTVSDKYFDINPDHGPKKYNPIINVNDLKNDVVLISASPGMGKSSLLSYVAEQTRNEDTSLFVYKANLANYCKDLYRIGKENITLKQAVRFVFIATQIESVQIEESKSAFNLLIVQEDGSVSFSPNARFDQLTHLRALVFRVLYNTGKIVLLLDGFDEIAPSYCETTLKLLQTLKRCKVRKMWVTTRPYDLVNKLENYLETFAFTLRPLSEHDQITFFENFWAHATKLRRTDISFSVNEFLRSLRTKTFTALENQETNGLSSFLSVPLHCYMLAKVFVNNFEEFHLQDDLVAFNATEKPLTIFALYSEFFNIKFHEIQRYIPLQNKEETAKRDHGKLALLDIIFDEKLLSKLISDEEKKRLLDSVTSGTNKIGIVAKVVDNKPRFVHRTFAEYFAAYYLAEILLSNDVKNEVKHKAAKSLLYEGVTRNLEYHYVLFTFFNHFVVSKVEICENKDIFEAAMAGNIAKLSEFEKVNEIFDPLNRTPIHLIAFNVHNALQNFVYSLKHNCQRRMVLFLRSFMERLCQSMSIRSADTLFAWTSAHYLTMCSSRDVERIIPFLVYCLNDVTQDILGRTPLILLTLRNPLFIYLIEKAHLNLNLTGLNTQDKFLKTALHYVLDFVITESYVNLYDHYSVVYFLLNHGACINISDDRGRKPKDMIKILIDIYEAHVFSIKTFGNLDCSHMFLTNWKCVAKSVQKYCILRAPEHFVYRKYRNSHYCVRKFVKITRAMFNRRRMTQYEEKLMSKILNELYKNCYRPTFPILNSEMITLWYFDDPMITKILINITNLHSILSAGNNHRNNMVIFLLFHTKNIASIFLSSFPTLVDIVDSRGNTALYYAFENNNKIYATNLIRNNALIGILDQGNAFHQLEHRIYKFMSGLPDDVAKLLTVNMNIFPARTQTEADFTVKILLGSKYADIILSLYPDLVNTKNSNGRTALHIAVACTNDINVCKLMHKNARADIADNDGIYPAHLLKDNLGNVIAPRFCNRNYDLLKFLNHLPFKFAKSLILTIPLFPARTSSALALLDHIFNKLPTIASVLWAEYSNLLKTTDLNENSSYFDCSKVSNEVVCILLQEYCIEDFSDIAIKSNDVLNLVVELFSSVKNNKLSQVLNVLRCVEYSYIKPNFVNVNFMNVENNVAASVVNARTEDGGKTALHYVAEIGDEEIARCLLSHGAWYNVPDFQGSTPTQIAETFGNRAVFRLLNVVSELFDCLYKGNYKDAQTFIKKERIDGKLFYSVCFETNRPLIYLIDLKYNNFEKPLLMEILIDCYQFKDDLFDYILISVTHLKPCCDLYQEIVEELKTALDRIMGIHSLCDFLWCQYDCWGRYRSIRKCCFACVQCAEKKDQIRKNKKYTKLLFEYY